MFTGRKLPLTLAFGVLVIVAIGASCKGFFPDPTLSSIAIQPPTPQVAVGSSLTLQAWGTYNDGSRSQITSGVAWTSSGQGSTVNVDDKGVMTGVNIGGTATITAAAQGLNTTAQATAYLPNVSNFEVCEGSYDSGTVCTPSLTWKPIHAGGGQDTQQFYSKGVDSNQVKHDLTQVSTWTPSDTTAITCDNALTPAVCTLSTTPTAGSTYTIVVTYGTSDTATINVSVQ